jgi:hypothetical protein
VGIYTCVIDIVFEGISLVSLLEIILRIIIDFVTYINELVCDFSIGGDNCCLCLLSVYELPLVVQPEVGSSFTSRNMSLEDMIYD